MSAVEDTNRSRQVASTGAEAWCQSEGGAFRVVDERRTFRFAYGAFIVIDERGILYDRYRTRDNAERAAKALCNGAAFYPHDVIGCRVQPSRVSL